MPGELGEVVPKMASIPLPRASRSRSRETSDDAPRTPDSHESGYLRHRTVRPDFALRCLKWSNYNAVNWDDLIWDRRLAVNSGYEVWGAKTYKSHGMRAVIGRKEMQKAHPEYYALRGTVRDTKKNGTGTPCLRSEGLMQETVRYCRAVFDEFDEPMVCIWPTDGFKQCQCELCRDIDSVPDYVWGFVDRVAREVYKTHPDRKVSCGAYASYVAPPPSIDKFSPNVVVYIANRGRPGFGDPERWKAYWATIEGWRSKIAPGNIVRGENNLYTLSMGGRSGPVAFAPLHPREFAKDLQALKGVCMGERNESPRGIQRGENPYTWRAPGLDHLNLYVNARFLWDADQDIETVLDEYYTLFYGPARDEMQAAFDFADANFPAAAGQKKAGGWVPPMEVRAEFVEKLHTAREAAGETVYGRRVQLILDELPPLDELRLAKNLAVQRGDDVITYDRLMNLHNDGNRDNRGTFNPDGKLDEPFWQWYPHGRNLQDANGGRPSVRTTFMARWYNNNIYFGIRCEEDGDEAPNISTTRDDDPAILDGDRIELLIETTPETCYRLVINPAGALLDRETTAEGDGTAWSSNADVGVHVGDGFWSVEIRIPVAGEGEAGMDHLNRMVGRTPTRTWPWYFNVGRVRVRGDETHVMAYSPIGDRDLTDRAKFGRLRLR
jgi:hypothetical protein